MVILNPTVERTKLSAFDGEEDHQRNHFAGIQQFVSILLDRSHLFVYIVEQTDDEFVLRHRCSPYDGCWFHHRKSIDAVCQLRSSCSYPGYSETIECELLQVVQPGQRVAG